jgi:hypothetical protein
MDIETKLVVVHKNIARYIYCKTVHASKFSVSYDRDCITYPKVLLYWWIEIILVQEISKQAIGGSNIVNI